MSDVPIVDFIVAGTMKGGTSALAAFLAQHPQIFIPRQKELHFFDVDDNYMAEGHGPRYDLYHNFFKDRGDAKLCGEATPIYMYLPFVPARIAEYNPKIKLIIALRNPIQRAYSHYRMECVNGRENLPFYEALEAERSRITYESDPAKKAASERWHSYVGRGLYGLQLMNVFTHIPREQVLVLESEKLLNEHDLSMEQCCDFLGLDVFIPPFQKVFEGSVETPPLTDEAYEFLQKKFAPDIKRLEALLGWDLSHWKV